MTRFDTLLGKLSLPSPKAYKPDFHVKTLENGFRLYDGSRALAHFYQAALDIWAYSPFEPDILYKEEHPDQLVDLFTLRNTMLGLGCTIWPKHWGAGKFALSKKVQWTWLSDRGEKLVVQVKMPAPDGESAQWIFTLDYDPTRGQYRWQADIEARKLDPDPMEFFNLMIPGALADHASRRRWTHSVWENPDGKLRRIVHSNALLMCTEYTGDRDHESGPWRSRNMPYPQAWYGYAANEQFNPFVFVHQTNAPLFLATCDALFDEHLLWQTAGQDNLDENGYFHTSAKLELVNLPYNVACELMEQGSDPVEPRKWRDKKTILPFHVDRVTDFESEVALWEPESSPIFKISTDPDAPITWAKREGRDASHAIRFNGSEIKHLQLYPIGAVCQVQPGKRYKLRGHIRTQGVTHHARLELASFEYSQTNTIDVACSENINGNTDWTCVEAELTVANQHYVLPKMVLYGEGQAWFDDLELIPIHNSPACHEVYEDVNLTT